jgi:hypothetical protein
MMYDSGCHQTLLQNSLQILAVMGQFSNQMVDFPLHTAANVWGSGSMTHQKLEMGGASINDFPCLPTMRFPGKNREKGYSAAKLHGSIAQFISKSQTHGPHGKQNPDKNDGLSHFPEKIQFAWVTKGESPHHSQMTSLGFPGAKTGEPGEWGIFFSHPPNEKPWFLSGSLHINGTIFSEAFNIRGMRLSSRSRGFYPNNHMCHMGFNENAVISM